MMKTIALTAVAIVMTTAAHAGVSIAEKATPVFKSEPITETVRICSKVKDRTTEGAIIGGLLGAQDGKAGVGALIGAVLGNAAGGHDKCHTETRTVGSRDILVGYNVHLYVDGVRTTIYVPK